MKKLIQLLVILSFVPVLNGCDKKPCPKAYYPTLVAVDKIQREDIVYEKDGSLKTKPAQRIGNKIDAFYVIQDYYWNHIERYNRKYSTKDKK